MTDSQVRSILVDGLNIGDYVFNWKDRLIIAHLNDEEEKADRNIVNVHVVIPRPWKQPPPPPQDPKLHLLSLYTISEEEGLDRGETLEIVNLFLACYHLTNYPFPMPRVIVGGWGVSTLSEGVSPMAFSKSGHISYTIRSSVLPISQQEAVNALNASVPIFDRVMKILENKNNPLRVALIVYQRVMQSQFDDLTNLIDLVTILESLFTRNDGEVAFKFALRTSIFVEKNNQKRRELFDKLRDVYRKRSDLIHGNYITLEPTSVYHQYQNFLIPIVRMALVNYINLSEEKTKNQIIDDIDNNALGLSSEYHKK